MEVRRRRIAKNKRKVVFRLLFLFFILLLIAAGVVGGILLMRNSASNLLQLTELDFRSDNQYIYTGAGFLYLKENSLHYVDIYNEKNSYQAAASVEAVKLAGSPTIQLLYNSANVQLVDGVYPVEFNGTLLSVKCGNGYFAALRSDAQGQESIQVFDKGGTPQDHLQYSGQFIMDYGFYMDTNEYLYVVALKLESGTPQTNITIYGMTEKSTSGIMKIQNQMIEQMRICPAGIYAVGTNQIIRYAHASKRESGQLTVYGWQVMDFDGAAAPLFLLKPRSSETLGTVKLVITKDGDIVNTTQRLFQLPAGTLDAYVMNNRLIAVTANGYTAFGTDGKNLGEKRFSEAIEGVKKLDSTTLLLMKGVSYYTVKVA